MDIGDAPVTGLRLDRYLLRSRFGRRLLGLFLLCALTPMLAVAYLSFRSVREQLIDQSVDQLQSVAHATTRTIHDRLELIESDLRALDRNLDHCATGRPGRPARCGEDLLYGMTGIVRIGDGAIASVVGATDTIGLRAGVERLGLGPGESAALELGTAPTRVYVVHRPFPDRAEEFVAGELDPSYLWGGDAAEGLPPSIVVTAWGAAHRDLLRNERARGMEAAAWDFEDRATGLFSWRSEERRYLAVALPMPSRPQLRIPGWQLVVSRDRSEVLAAMEDFIQTFPLVVAIFLLAAIGFGLNQIRRSLVPLHALQHGTRRLAEQEFEHRVEIRSGDEIEDLATSFNTMAGHLGRQFEALRAIAEIDRAILSSVDRTRIVETVLTRLPSLIRCETIGVYLTRTGADDPGTAWVSDGSGRVHLQPGDAEFSPDDLDRLLAAEERLQIEPGIARPGYLIGLGDETGRVDVFPIRYGTDVFAALAVRWPAGHPPADTDLITVRQVANQLAVALGNAGMVEQVRYMALYDSLTGLPNRVFFKDALLRAIRRADRTGRHVAICFLDLDRFSSINDTLGHDIGDDLVREVSSRLRTCCRDTDLIARIGGDSAPIEIARLGGDEFTVVLPDLTDPQDAGRVARRLLGTFEAPFRLGTHEVFVTGSIGIAVYPEDGGTPDELLKNADVAMYHAKDQGGNTYRLFSASMNAEAMARMQLEQQLRRALDAEQFFIVYQPIAELSTGRICGAEALIRWNHPERGLVTPGQFITLLEESGLIVRLGGWIIHEVCLQARAWHDAGLSHVRINLNLSARQLQQADFVAQVRTILAETGADPEALVLELTESALFQPGGQVAEAITALAALGLRFAVDDFGTGYSSLGYLKHFPIDTLKIDRSFVKQITVDANDAAIAAAIVALGSAMDMDVVAEGVETLEQAMALRKLGCTRVQGYLIGAPMTAEEFAGMRAHRTRTSIPGLAAQ